MYTFNTKQAKTNVIKQYVYKIVVKLQSEATVCHHFGNNHF